MRYIGTVAVEGPASFVRALIEETDVDCGTRQRPSGRRPGPGEGRAPRATTAGATATIRPRLAATSRIRDETAREVAQADAKTRSTRAEPQSRAAIASRIGFGMFFWAASRDQ